MLKTQELVDYPAVKGFVKLELFDERGKKVDETEGYNYLSPFALDRIKYGARSILFNGMGAPGYQDPNPFQCFDEIYLSDSTAAEVSTSGHPEGTCIGYANKTTYVGTDVYRGSPNMSESLAIPASTSWVFDWPTHAALGNINSVGFRVANGNINWGMPATASNYMWTQWGHSAGCLATMFLPDGRLIALGYGQSDPMHALTLNSAGAVTASTPWGPTGAQIGSLYQSGSVNWVGGATHDGVNMYTVGWRGNSTPGSATVRKFTLPTGTGAVTATNVSIAGFTNLVGVVYDGSMIWVADSVQNKVVRVNKSTGAIDRQFTTNSPEGLGFDPARNTLWVSSNAVGLREYDFNGTLVTQTSHTLGVTVGYAGIPVYYWNSPNSRGDLILHLYGYNNSGTNTINNYNMEATMGSRIKLASTISKSSLQTLKCTYTFTYA